MIVCLYLAAAYDSCNVQEWARENEEMGDTHTHSQRAVNSRGQKTPHLSLILHPFVSLTNIHDTPTVFQPRHWRNMRLRLLTGHEQERSPCLIEMASCWFKVMFCSVSFRRFPSLVFPHWSKNKFAVPSFISSHFFRRTYLSVLFLLRMGQVLVFPCFIETNWFEWLQDTLRTGYIRFLVLPSRWLRGSAFSSSQFHCQSLPLLRRHAT